MAKIRILIAVLGLDQHEVGAISISRSLRDAGMEVIYAGRFNFPPIIVKTALEEDANMIGLSCHSWEYLYYIVELIELLKENHAEIPIIVGGSVVTPDDRKILLEKGVAAAFGPTSPTEDIIQTIKRITKI
jgi:methylmalonyl-CoA mutase C-terminal domain/subunit